MAQTDVDQWAAAGASVLQQDRTEQIKASMGVALPGNPDQEAQLRRYAQQVGVPMESARALPDQVKVQAQLSAFDAHGLASQFPATGQWLTNPDNARVAVDDVHQITQVEQAVRALHQPVTPTSGEPSIWDGAFWSKAGNYLIGGNPGNNNLDDDLMSAGRALAGKIGMGGALALSGITTTLDRTGLTSTLGDTTLGWAKYYDDQVRAEAAKPTEFHNKLIQSAATLGLQLPAIMATGGASEAPAMGMGVLDMVALAVQHGAKGMAIPAVTDAVHTMSQVYAQTGDISQAARAAEVAYANTVAGGVVPLSAPGKLLARLLGGAAVGATQGEVSRQAMNAALPDGMQQPFDWETVALNAVTSSLMAGVMGPRAEPQRAAAVRAFNEAYEVARSDALNQQVSGLAEAANASKLRERDPAAFKQLVADFANRGDLPPVLHIDAGKLEQILTDAGVTGDELHQTMPRVAEQLDALRTGDGPSNVPVEIPVEDFATHIAGSELEKPLLAQMRVTPEGRTVAESETFRQEQQAEMQARAEQLDASHAADTEYQASLDKMNAQVDAQLAGLKMRPDQLTANSALLRAFYQVQAERMGIAPHEFAERYPVQGTNRALEDGGFDQSPDTPEFKAWFGDSKVVDDQGKPLVVYHGTRAQFSVFDYSKIGEQGRAEGAGFYFTNSKKVAAGYGSPMEVFLSINKPLPYAAKGFSKPTVQKIVQRVAAIEAKAEGNDIADGFLSNFGDVRSEGLPAVVREAAKMIAADETALDQLSGIVGSGVNAKFVNEATRDVTGYDGVVADGFSDAGGGDNRIFVAFFPEQIKSATGNRGTYDPNDPSILNQQARGTYSPSTKTIALLKGANLSTFQHELGHFFLDTLTHMAAMPDAPAEVRADVAALFKWGGITDLTDWHTRTVDQQRELHEKFATGWETYLMRGQAPTLELRNLFARFRSWMVSVYKNLKGAPGDFTPEVQGVFDRMIASEAAIKEAELARRYMPLFDAPGKEGIPLEEWAAYQAQGKDATEVAIEQLTGKSLRDMAAIDRLRTASLKSVQKDAAAKFKEIEREVRAEVMSQPVYRAWQFLTGRNKEDLAPEVQAAHQAALADWKDQRATFETDTRDRLKAEAWAASPLSKNAKGLVKGQFMSKNKARIELDVKRHLLDYDQANPKPEAPKPDTSEDTNPETGSGRLDYGSVLDLAGPVAAMRLRSLKMTVGSVGPTRSTGGELDVTRDSLLVAMAKLGGVEREGARRDLGVPADDLKADVGVFGKKPFRKEGGLSPEQMVEALIEHHYLTPEHGLHELEDAVREELAGSPQHSMAFQHDREMPMAPGSMHPDMVADLFGFSSGDELARTLAAADHPSEVVRGLAEQRMLERHGEIASPADMARTADALVANEVRAKFIATELKALKQAVGSASDIAKAAKEVALQTIEAQRVRDIREGRYTAAGTRAARDAEKLLAKGDMAGAATAKRDQLLNLELTRAAREAKDWVKSAAEYLRKFDTAAIRKSVDPDYVDQIQTLLERFDLRSQSGTAIDRKNNLRTWVQSRLNAGEMPLISESLLSAKERMAYEKQINSRDEEGNLVYPDDDERIKLLADAIEASAQRSYKDMTLSELRGLVDTVKNIEHLGRTKDKLLTAKDAASFSERRDLLTATLKDNAKNSGKNVRTDNTWIGKRLDGLKQFGVSHIKPATWAQRFDGGPGNGPWWSTIIRPANERAAWETSQRAAATERLMEIFKPVLPKVNYLDKIGKGKFIPEIGTSLNWEERFAIACNYGNESNLQRLMGGGIAGTTKRLTMEQVQAVLRTLSADEWHAVQGVWDHFETYRPEIAAKERRVSGIEPQWIEARAFSVKTSDGQTLDLRGGYFPVVYDPKTSLKAEQHADSQAAKDAMKAAYSAATTQRSFTKARVEEVTDRPLLLNLRGLYSGVNDVIHDLAWHEWVIDMNRFMRSSQIDEAMREHYGPNVKREFTKWRDDIVAGSKRLDHGVENAAGWARKFVSASALTYNVMSAIMQPLGITQSFARVGTRWVGQGLAEYVGNPVAATRSVREQSEFMRNRSRTLFRDINELRNRVGGQTTGRELMGRYGYFLTMQMQMTVDVPTWIGARNKALSEGHDDATAVALADQAVKDSQGGGEEVDQAGITRGGPLVKLFTAFYDFMNTQANTLYLSGTTSKSRAEAFWHFAMVGVLTPVLAKALKDAITPGDSGNWDDWQSTVKTMVSEGLQNLIGMVAFGREFSTAAKKLMGDSKGQGYSGPTGLRVIPDSAKLAEQAAQGEFDDAFRKASINWAGDVSGIPAVQANRTITGAQALSEGKTLNPAALALGYQEPR